MGGGTRYATPRSASCCDLGASLGAFPLALLCANCERRTPSGFILGNGLDGPYIRKDYTGCSVKLDSRGFHVKFTDTTGDSFGVSRPVSRFRMELDEARSDAEVADFLRKNPGLVK